MLMSSFPYLQIIDNNSNNLLTSKAQILSILQYCIYYNTNYYSTLVIQCYTDHFPLLSKQLVILDFE